MEATASAPGKVILFGEHFVVHGEPAIVCAINMRVYVKVRANNEGFFYLKSKDLRASGTFKEDVFIPEEGGVEASVKLEPIKLAAERTLQKLNQSIGLSIEVRSELPVAAGLGSSAAVASATAAAVNHLFGDTLTKEDISQISLEAERLIHGKPSGIDPAITTFGGILLFSMKEGFKKIPVKGELPLVIGDVGVERSTGKMVTIVNEVLRRYPHITGNIFKVGRLIVQEAVEALETSDLYRLGELMNINHGLLSAIGVSHEKIEKLVYAARKFGALGSKLTGAGGGGCMIALTVPEKIEGVVKAIEEAGGRAYIAEKTDEGVRIEE